MGNQPNWSIVEKLRPRWTRFISWATDEFIWTNGAHYRYAVVCDAGVFRWVVWHYCSVRDRFEDYIWSNGGFYDGVDDHPEDAVAWATTSAERHKATHFLRE